MRPLFISSGHSTKPGRDCGAAGNGLIEGVEAAKIRKRTVEIMKSKYNVVTIIDKDDSILSETIAFAKNKLTTDAIVIDIHFNAGPVTATGVECLVPKEYTLFELELARKISVNMSEIMQIPLRGILNGRAGVKDEASSHHGRLGFMRLTGENVLIELCFISNPSDVKKYLDNFERICESLADIFFSFMVNREKEQIHIVKSGDSLYGIARNYGVSATELMTINKLNTKSIIKINDKLLIPKK